VQVDSATLQDWVAILRAVPGSILWMIRFGTSAASEANLQAAAERAGLDDGRRLVFTDPLPGRLHLHVKVPPPPRVQLVREGGTRRVHLVREGGGCLPPFKAATAQAAHAASVGAGAFTGKSQERSSSERLDTPWVDASLKMQALADLFLDTPQYNGHGFRRCPAARRVPAALLLRRSVGVRPYNWHAAASRDRDRRALGHRAALDAASSEDGIPRRSIVCLRDRRRRA
jgi:hypothetical protein